MNAKIHNKQRTRSATALRSCIGIKEELQKASASSCLLDKIGESKDAGHSGSCVRAAFGNSTQM